MSDTERALRADRDAALAFAAEQTALVDELKARVAELEGELRDLYAQHIHSPTKLERELDARVARLLEACERLLHERQRHQYFSRCTWCGVDDTGLQPQHANDCARLTAERVIAAATAPKEPKP